MLLDVTDVKWNGFTFKAWWAFSTALPTNSQPGQYASSYISIKILQ